MKQLKLENVELNFEQILDDVLVSGGPIKIVKDTGNAILVSEEIWSGMTETLNLVSMPGMRESLLSELREPITQTTTALDW